MLYHIVMSALVIWAVLSISYWVVVIFGVITKDIKCLEYAYINSIWQLVCALLFPFIYIVVILIIWIFKFFRNIFTIFR